MKEVQVWLAMLRWGSQSARKGAPRHVAGGPGWRLEPWLGGRGGP